MNSKFGSIVLASILMVVATHSAHAEETVGEKLATTANDNKRVVKKGIHRLKEAVCMEGDVKCASKKIKNRAVEAKDATVDGVKSLKNKID